MLVIMLRSNAHYFLFNDFSLTILIIYLSFHFFKYTLKHKFTISFVYTTIHCNFTIKILQWHNVVISILWLCKFSQKNWNILFLIWITMCLKGLNQFLAKFYVTRIIYVYSNTQWQKYINDWTQQSHSRDSLRCITLHTSSINIRIIHSRNLGIAI